MLMMLMMMDAVEEVAFRQHKIISTSYDVSYLG